MVRTSEEAENMAINSRRVFKKMAPMFWIQQRALVSYNTLCSQIGQMLLGWRKWKCSVAKPSSLTLKVAQERESV